MTTTLIRNTDVTRPTTESLNSSILDHVRAAGNLNDNMAHFGLRNNEGLWPSYNCMDLLTPTPICPDPGLDENGEHKDFAVAPWVPSFEFAVQGGVQCSLVGLDRDDQKAEVARVFGLTEGKAIERALKDMRFVERTADAPTPRNIRNQGEWDEAEDITPSTAVDLKQAVALLEGIAASRYVGVPTLHLPRAAVSLLSGDRVVWKNDLAYTQAGAKVAAGGGYDDETMLVSGVWDLYATGEVYVERAPAVNVQQIVVPGDNAKTVGNLDDNTSVALAERQYRVALDCFVVHISATIF